MSLQQDAPSPAENEIRTLYRALLDGWNRRNAAAFAEQFTSDGNVTGFDGSQMNGRAEIEATLGQIFASHQTAPYIAIVREARFLSPDVAMLRAVVGMSLPDRSDINPAVNAIQSIVAVRGDGTWRIALLQTTPAQFHGRPDLAQQLTEELRQLLR
ncbi:MAG TPA: SgcJ/EcaC family oxidoreductase [Ktedonosporobacter sp.]|nr:SgcJ/EcaC family oxidoreductase [Ktedonosporobacter sp.]